MADGYQGLRDQAAWIDLTGRGLIVASGEDRARLLHAMTTNHIQELQPGQGCYAFFLTAQGRILADACILCRENSLLIETEPETARLVYEHLEKYIIADDVTLHDATGEHAILGLEGPEAGRVLQSLGAVLPERPFHFTQWGETLVLAAAVTGGPGYRLILASQGLEMLHLHLESGGIPAASEEAVRTVRLELGTPRYGEDIFETTLPQETRLMHALHFNKGCYLGQEIVERIRSRGHVNKLLTGLRIEGSAVPQRGARVLAEDKPAGEISSAALSPFYGCVTALAYLRSEIVSLRKPLSVDGAAAQIVLRP